MDSGLTLAAENAARHSRAAGAAPAPAPAVAPAGLTLATAPVGRPFTVRKVIATEHAPDWTSQLADIGFFPGERVAVMARGMPGNDPLVVRIGMSTFALRAAEAACVHIEPVVANAEAADPAVLAAASLAP